MGQTDLCAEELWCVPEVRESPWSQGYETQEASPPGESMTKHWDQAVCAGCEYLRKYGMPESFIRDDHELETSRYACLKCGRHYEKSLAELRAYTCPVCGGPIEYVAQDQGAPR